MQHLNHYRKHLTFRFASGAAGADLIPTLGLPFQGEILHIRQINNNNTGNRTAQLTIEDKAGLVIWDGTAKNDNTTTDHEFVSTRRVIADGDVLKCTLSGDPGSGGAKVDVLISLYGRDA